MDGAWCKTYQKSYTKYHLLLLPETIYNQGQGCVCLENSLLMVMLENCKKPDYAHPLLMIKFLKILCSQQQRGVDKSHLCERYSKQALGSSSCRL